MKFIQEKKLISIFFDEIAQDTGKYCFGVDDTLKCLDLGAVQTLIVWEALEITRYQFKVPAGARMFLYRSYIVPYRNPGSARATKDYEPTRPQGSF